MDNLQGQEDKLFINYTFSSWNFNDGNTSNAVSPSHTFTQAGSYTVTLLVENNNLKIMIAKDGRVIFSGVVKWIGNREDNSPGTVMCIASSERGGKDSKHGCERGKGRWSAAGHSVWQCDYGSDHIQYVQA